MKASETSLIFTFKKSDKPQFVLSGGLLFFNDSAVTNRPSDIETIHKIIRRNCNRVPILVEDFGEDGTLCIVNGQLSVTIPLGVITLGFNTPSSCKCEE